ncbi:hypothetical protein WJ17_16360 [Burkholderia vietnamiensis]|nr:hypothetical protein WJ17_16360 [Burkholderia vietnamiensis]
MVKIDVPVHHKVSICFDRETTCPLHDCGTVRPDGNDTAFVDAGRACLDVLARDALISAEAIQLGDLDRGDFKMCCVCKHDRLQMTTGAISRREWLPIRLKSRMRHPAMGRQTST